MFCPVCKTEYRKGFNSCSDCHIELVDVLPLNDSPKSFSVLWSGESTVFQDKLLQELELAKIGALEFRVTSYSGIRITCSAAAGNRDLGLPFVCKART
jgi:hypothetical protein